MDILFSFFSSASGWWLRLLPCSLTEDSPGGSREGVRIGYDGTKGLVVPPLVVEPADPATPQSVWLIVTGSIHGDNPMIHWFIDLCKMLADGLTRSGYDVSPVDEEYNDGNA